MKKVWIILTFLFITSCAVFNKDVSHTRQPSQVSEKISTNCPPQVLALISPEECLAISDYKQVEYTEINYFLRKGVWNSKDLTPMLNFLKNGVTKLPIYKGMVYRGTSLENSPKLFKSYTTIGNTVSDPAFSSSSIDRKVAESFLTDNGDSKFVLMIINSKNGRDLAGIGASGIDQAEKEILFLPATQFKILNVKKVKITYPEYGLENTTVYEVYMEEE